MRPRRSRSTISFCLRSWPERPLQSFGRRTPRWGVIAAFQLWLIHLKAKQFEDADAVLSAIKVRFPKETISRYVPIAIRTEIDAQFVFPVINWLVLDPKLIPQLESAVRLAD